MKNEVTEFCGCGECEDCLRALLEEAEARATAQRERAEKAEAKLARVEKVLTELEAENERLRRELAEIVEETGYGKTRTVASDVAEVVREFEGDKYGIAKALLELRRSLSSSRAGRQGEG